MENFRRAMASVATALDIPFGGLRTTPNHQYQGRNKDLCGA